MIGTRSTQPSPLLESAVAPTFNRSQSDLLLFSSRSKQRPQPPGGRSTAPNTPGKGVQRKPSGSFSQSFKFPPSPGKNPAIDISLEEEPRLSPKTRMESFKGHSPVLSDGNTPISAGDRLSPATRILAGTSMNGTPRSSGEFYAMSTNSTDTLASEYISQQQPTSRLLPSAMRPGPPDRSGSALAPSAQQRSKQSPEVLMMGYAQISGTFTLDGSLVNQAPFEEVKRKGVLGSRVGGGVVGVEQNRATKRPDSGLFGSLGWSSIGESLTGLLGTSEPSSIREMRGMAKEKKVPLLSTPQSILFVDLRLQPGEERKFEYKMQLPRGLPPSFRGRAIKVAYVVNVGVQRAGSVGGKGQGVKSVEVPFKVLGSVTPNGDVLGHDLMSPYIILRDESTVTTIPPPNPHPSRNGSSPSGPANDNEAATDFLTYVNNLLSRPRASATSPNEALLSPTDPAPQPGRLRRRSTTEDIEPQPRTMKEAIALAIQRANVPSPVQSSTTSPSQSRNSYAIARSGRPIANITLSRPCFRLGETIPISIDLSRTATPVIAVSVSLETHENVDPAIAMRSAGSIARVTRRVWQRWESVTMWARRVGVQLQVPPTACPEFVTSGVGLGWGLRVGFVVLRDTKRRWQDIIGSGLLEEVTKDERGTILAAVEKVGVESFEVVVPVRVYGAVVGNDVAGAGTGEGSEGLAI
ncbi:Rgp1-domain-containing protein [Saccharata proteae CBS 121410]|uniref:Rgp1-domain-containing protein n=1 Tax=Saccharata proteae CBS 121410 TaxID=1314787 RepID=A0A9P4HVE5_9PEZI|nr:Rgp1-domain-containing protein [Saccharata proteae CBS 121410]